MDLDVRGGGVTELVPYATLRELPQQRERCRPGRDEAVLAAMKSFEILQQADSFEQPGDAGCMPAYFVLTCMLGDE